MDNGQKLFFPVPGLLLEGKCIVADLFLALLRVKDIPSVDKDLLDWQNDSERNLRRQILKHLKKGELPLHEPTLEKLLKRCSGKSIVLNDEKIALFRIGKLVYAIQSICPHAGGPLHLADIEDMGTNHVCVKCPWHKWKFSLNNGATVFPKGFNTVAKTYPVKVGPNGHIFIGFDSFGPSAFNLEN